MNLFALDEPDVLYAMVLGCGTQQFSHGQISSQDSALNLEHSHPHLTVATHTANFSINTLLAKETGSDKCWFDAVALLNLGLAERKAGCKRETQQFLWRAAELYAEQQLQSEQPQEWQKVLDHFSTLSRWAATGERDEWINLLTQFETYADEQSELIQQLSEVARIMLGYTMGEDVRQASVDLVEQGISRTFLSAILLERSG